MSQICYHLISDHHDEFKNTIEDVKGTVHDWEIEGEEHIEVFKIETTDLGSDAIDLEEKKIDPNEFNK